MRLRCIQNVNSCSQLGRIAAIPGTHFARDSQSLGIKELTRRFLIGLWRPFVAMLAVLATLAGTMRLGGAPFAAIRQTLVQPASLS